jgi:hypothetical protein
MKISEELSASFFMYFFCLVSVSYTSIFFLFLLYLLSFYLLSSLLAMQDPWVTTRRPVALQLEKDPEPAESPPHIHIMLLFTFESNPFYCYPKTFLPYGTGPPC